MSNFVFAVDADNFLDNPNMLGLESRVNTILAALLSNDINGVAFVANDQARANGNEYKLTVSYDDVGTAITSPYLVKGFVGATAEAVATAVQAFMSANPTYFFSATFTQQLRSDRRTAQSVAILFYNTDAVDGATNWAVNGGGGGGGGGDIVLTGVLALGLNVVDNLSLASIGDAIWEVELVKTTNRYSSSIRANHNGTTPNFGEYGLVLSPGNGTFDVVTDVDASAGDMRLTVTTSSTGWAYRVRRRALAA